MNNHTNYTAYYATIKELNDTYKFSKEHDSTKEKDDYDIEI